MSGYAREHERLCDEAAREHAAADAALERALDAERVGDWRGVVRESMAALNARARALHHDEAAARMERATRGES